jgi:hypothetical protein
MIDFKDFNDSFKIFVFMVSRRDIFRIFIDAAVGDDADDDDAAADDDDDDDDDDADDDDGRSQCALWF